MPSPLESKEQEIIFKWAQLSEKTIPELRLLYGSMNGVKLSIGAAVKAKRQGARKGWPDICWPIARGQWHGLFIELKRADRGVLSKEQKWFLSELTKQNYLAVCVHGADKAISILKMYARGDVEGLLSAIK